MSNQIIKIAEQCLESIIYDDMVYLKKVSLREIRKTQQMEIIVFVVIVKGVYDKHLNY